MEYARITFTVAFEDYGLEKLIALDYFTNAFPPEVTVLEVHEQPMLLVDDAAEKADQ